MKRTPRFVGEKKTRGAAPKEPPFTDGQGDQSRGPIAPIIQDPVTFSSPSDWLGNAIPSPRTIDLMDFLAKFLPVVDSLWKAELRWSKADPSEQGGSLKHLGRNLQAGLDALHSAGFEIKDHTNERYVEGSRVEVLAFQPVSGISQPTVIETLKPTVYFMDRLLRRGQIIVGKPIA